MICRMEALLFDGLAPSACQAATPRNTQMLEHVKRHKSKSNQIFGFVSCTRTLPVTKYSYKKGITTEQQQQKEECTHDVDG